MTLIYGLTLIVLPLMALAEAPGGEICCDHGNSSVTPEPGTLALLGAGIAVVLALKLKRKL